MMHSTLDSTLEAQLRAVIFLFLLDRPVDGDYLGALDTLTINARTFNIGPNNLNGPHRLASAELQTRTKLMSQALKKLALHGLATYITRPVPGFRITPDGEAFVNRLHTDYADQLFTAALDTFETVGDADTCELTALIISTTDSEGEA